MDNRLTRMAREKCRLRAQSEGVDCSVLLPVESCAPCFARLVLADDEIRRAVARAGEEVRRAG